jgi:hypothetical protein
LPKARKLQTNFTKGELSPLVEGRPDLAQYYEGAARIENFILLRQGGLTRRLGTRFIAEVKDSSKDTILVPFEPNIDSSYVIEMGNAYARFYKDKARLTSGGNPVELTTPYNTTNLRHLHFTESVDILYIFSSIYRQRRLARVDDTHWYLYDVTPVPPPTFEDSFDISNDVPGAGVGVQGGVSGAQAQPPGSGWIDPTLLPGGGVDSGTNGGDGGDGGGE